MIIEIPKYKLEPENVKGGKKYGRYQVIVLGTYNGYLHAIEIAGRAGRNVVSSKDVDIFAKKMGLKHIYRLGNYRGISIPKIDLARLSAKRVYEREIKKLDNLKKGYRTFIDKKIPSTIKLQDVAFGSDAERSLFPKPGDPIKLLSGEMAKIVVGYPQLRAKKEDGEIVLIKRHVKITTDDAGTPSFLETRL